MRECKFKYGQNLWLGDRQVKMVGFREFGGNFQCFVTFHGVEETVAESELRVNPFKIGDEILFQADGMKNPFSGRIVDYDPSDNTYTIETPGTAHPHHTGIWESNLRPSESQVLTCRTCPVREQQDGDVRVAVHVLQQWNEVAQWCFHRRQHNERLIETIERIVKNLEEANPLPIHLGSMLIVDTSTCQLSGFITETKWDSQSPGFRITLESIEEIKARLELKSCH